MATIANLSIGLSADSARLKKDLNKADAATKKWGSKQKKTFAGVTKAVRGVATAVAAIGASAMALRGMTNLAKEIGNLSNLTNMSTTELQRLDPALGSIGMSTEKYADIIKDVNDKMNDFLQTGGGPMKDFFEQIAPLVDVTADSFKGLSGKEGLQLYVDSLEKAGLSQEQMTFYMEAIASDSTMLLPLLRDQSAEMLRLGLATDQVIKSSVLADLKNLGVQFQTLTVIIRNTITNALGPLIGFIADAVEGWRMLITDFPAILTGIGAIATAIAALTVVMLANPVLAMVSAFLALIAAAGVLYKKISNLAENLGGFGQLFKLVADAGKFEFNKIGLYADQLRLYLALVFNGIQDSWQQAVHNMAIIFARWQDSLAGSALGELMGLTGGNEERVGAANGEAMRQLSDKFVSLSDELSRNTDLLNEANPHYAKLVQVMEAGVELKVDEIELSKLDLTKGGSLGGGGSGGKSTKGKEEKSWAQGIADDFAGVLKSELSDAIATGDWSTIGETLMDSLTMSIINSVVGQGIDFLMGAIGFNQGGIVPSTPNSKSYADSVPAMLQPGELVVPVDQVDNFMSGGSGGGGQTFNINITGDVSRLTRNEVVKMMPEIAAGTNMLNKENGRR